MVNAQIKIRDLKELTEGIEGVVLGVKRASSRSGEDLIRIDIDSQTPVKEICFYGLPPIRKGDRITAYVVRGSILPRWYRDFFCHLDLPERAAFDERELQESERAFELEISPCGERFTVKDYSLFPE